MDTAKYNILMEALKACLKADPGEIDVNENLIDAGILDSLDSMKFLFEVEQRCSGELTTMDDIEDDIFTFAKLASLIEIN